MLKRTTKPFSLSLPLTQAKKSWYSFAVGIKVLVPVLVAWLLSSALLVAFFQWQMSRQGYADLEMRLNNFVVSKAAELSNPMWAFEDDLVATLMSSYRHNDDLLSATLYDADGVVAVTIQGAVPADHSRTLRKTHGITKTSNGQSYNLGSLEVEYHDGRVQEFLSNRMATDALMICLIMAVLASVLLLSLHWIVGVPLMRIQNSLRKNAASGRLAPLEWASHDELGELVAAYNALLRQVEMQKRGLQEVNDTLRGEVAQRVRAEEQLVLAAQVFEVSIEAIAITDAFGAIQTVNRSVEALTGYPPEEVIGKKLDALGLGLHDHASPTPMFEQLEMLGFWTGDIWNLTKGGESYAARLTLFTLQDNSHRISHYVAVFHDITERKWSEANLVRARDEFEQQVALRTQELSELNDKLLELDKQRTAFVTSASHELRTPLTTMMGFTKLVRRDFLNHFAPLVPEEGALLQRRDTLVENLRIIVEEGERLTRLIEDMLDLSRIEAGRMQWRDKELDAVEEVRAVINLMLGGLPDDSKMDVQLHLDDGAHTIRFDRDRLHQVLINLFGNAIKFTRKGWVSIHIASLPTGFIQIRVEDNGPGIAQEHLELIFQKFFQGGDSDTDKPKGTGLGLAICRNILDHYHGRIWAESTQGFGCAIIVEIPAAATGE